MQALLLSGHRQLEIVNIDRPTIGTEEVLVRVAACGICGSDIHGYDGSTGRRVPPIVMGHEAAGIVAQIGEHVDRVGIGDRVTFDSTISCGQCADCARGRVNLCSRRRVLGVSCSEYRQSGAFAEYVAVPQHVVYRLPESLSFEHAAMVEPVSVALHAVSRLNVERDERALVVGSGMIGLLIIQALAIAGARDILAVDIDEDRLRLARELGAAATFNAKTGDALQGILETTDGQGADVALEVVGNTATLATAIDATRKGGRIALVGNLSAQVSFPLQTVVTRELSLFGSCAIAGEYPQAIELLASEAIRVRPLISAIAPLKEGPKWFETLYRNERGMMKVILRPE